MKKEKLVFAQSSNTNGLHIPAAALKLAELPGDGPLEYRVMPGTVIAYKKQMTAMELVHVANSLQELSDEFFSILCNVCGECEHCEEECPYDTADFEMDLKLPEALLKRAGIPQDAKLFAATAEGGVLICEAKQVPSLQSVPADLMDKLLACDICPGELEKHILKGEIVYGGA